MCSPVKDLFQLVLKILLNLCLIDIYKNSDISQASAEKHFKLVLRDQNRAVGILFLLVLLLAKADLISKKSSKKNLVKLFSFSSYKKVLILLTEVVIFYVGFSAIYV